ncbi:MAG: DNA internalization-related competence protein ComEC/Rec2 [Nitrospira sp.]|nr:DNA internalization-related competence protein ComEC/Rec2 [Nitrospira sp.]
MLPSLCVAFLTGLVLGSFLPFFPIALLFVLLVFMLILSALERAGAIDQPKSFMWSAVLCLGVVYWTAMTPPIADSARDDLLSVSSLEYTGRVVGLVQHGPSRQTMLVEIMSGSEGVPLTGRIKLTWRDPGEAVRAGDQIVFRARLRVPTGSLNPRGFDYAAYVERQNIEAVGTVTGPEAVHLLPLATEPNWWWRGWGHIDRWRGVIREKALQSLPQPTCGLFLGIVIGERGYVQEDLQEWFMTTGTIHLLSISGSHLGLIAVVVFGTIRRALTVLPALMLLGMSRFATPTRVAILCTWLIVTFYALLAGAELATMRAWVMICLGLATIWIGSERHLLHALAGAACLILLHDPRAIGDISFQLSFLSVLAIIWIVASPSCQDNTEEQPGTKWKVWGRHVREAVILGAAVTLVTTPLVAWYFNQVPWLGLATNLVAVPFTGMILVPFGLLSALVTLVNVSGDLPLAFIQERLLEWIVNALHWCATLPGSDWRVSAPPLWGMAVFYLGLPLIVGTIRLSYHRAIGTALVGMALGGWILSGTPIADGNRWRVTFLDVGQGDSALIQVPDGKTVLIDGGRRFERFDMGRGVIGPFLLNQGIRRLDHVIATHPQLDHVGGLPWIIRHLDVGAFWHTGIERSEPLFRELRQAVAERNVQAYVATRGDEVVRGESCRLTVLNPIRPRDNGGSIQSLSGTFLNNESVVAQLICGYQSVLFAADIETDGLHRLTVMGQSPVTVLKVPHHGARSSLDREWIALARPRYAVFSVGRHNSYGHPVPDVVEAYSAIESEVVRTDRDGAIIVTGRLSTSGIQVRRMRDLVLQPVIPRECLWDCEWRNWHRVWTQAHEF